MIINIFIIGIKYKSEKFGDQNYTKPKLETDIAKEARDTLEYTTAKRMVSTTKIDKKQREKADATVKQYETGWATRRQAAREDLTLAQEQLKEINERLGYGKKKPDNSGGGGAATDRPSIDSFQR